MSVLLITSPLSTILSICLPTATSNPFSQKPQLFSTLLYSLVPIIGLAAVVLFSFWMWRHHKLAYPAALVPTHVSQSCKEKLEKLFTSYLDPNAHHCNAFLHFTCQSHRAAGTVVSSFFKVAVDAVRVSLFVGSATVSTAPHFIR